MQNIYKNILLQNTSQLYENNNNFEKIVENGKCVYLCNDFNYKVFISSVKLFLHNNLNLKTETEDYTERIIGIKYKSSRSLAEKINIGVDFIIIFVKNDNILYFDVNLLETFKDEKEKSSQITLSSLLNDSYKKEISKFIYETIYSNCIKKIPDIIFNFENTFIEEIHNNERVFLINSIENEKILAKLNISSVKLNDKEENLKIYNSSFIITDKSAAIIGFNIKGECVLFETNINKFKIKKGLTKKTLVFDNFSCYPKRSNSKLFNQIVYFYKHTGRERVIYFAKLNYLNNNYNTAKNLIEGIKNEEPNPFLKFKLLLIKVKQNQTNIEDEISEEKLKEITHEIFSSADAENKIIDIFNKWEISYNDKAFFLELFVNTDIDKNEKKIIIPLYKVVRKEFQKKNKNKINQIVFDIKYAEFLIECNKNRSAVNILKKLLKHLPDETISDVLPSKELNISGKNSGQLLKIKILDLISLAKGIDKSEKEILQLAQLQPLNKSAIKKLASIKDEKLNKKAVEIISILKEEGLKLSIKETLVQKYGMLNFETLNNKLRHPATIKKGNFYSVQKWISKIKADDYSSVKEYSEIIKVDNYPKLFEIIDNIRYIFNIKEIEFYISRGEKCQNIIGYEGKPPFIVIGYKHLDKNSELYLNFKELQFAVAVEVAHIFYKHSRISSKDVWRGVIDKGSVLLDALLAVVPVAGIAGKSVQNSYKLGELTSILKRSNQISNGKNVFDAATRLSEYYKSNLKTDSKTKKEQKLLVASRLMQYTADRAAILISGDIKSAVRAIFLTGKYNFEYFDEAINTSLCELILKTNNDGTYKHQDLALRIAHLFSFYLSETFSDLRDILIKVERN